MIRTSFITRTEIGNMITAAQVNKTRTAQRTFTEKETLYIFKYLRRTDVWTRISKTTYTNSNGTVQLTFLSNTQIKVEA